MTTILEFLRKGFYALEDLPKEDVDGLIERIRLYRLNPNRGDNNKMLNDLLSDILFYYYNIGKKIAQVQAVKDRLELQMEHILAHTKVKGVNKEELIYNSSNKTAFKFEALKTNKNYELYRQQYIDCTSLETYLKNIHTTLFMEHYALRNQSQPVSNMHYTINH